VEYTHYIFTFGQSYYSSYYLNNEDGRTGAGVHVALAFGAHVTVWWKKAPLNNIYPNAACIEDKERYDPTSLGCAAFSKTGHMLQVRKLV